jgi:hypothetical protein
MSLKIANRGVDMFASGHDVIVIPVNARGTASATPGKGGLAGVARCTWPTWFQDYQAACDRGAVPPGGLHVHGRLDGALMRAPQATLKLHPKAKGPRIILGVATKDHWRNNSRIEWVKSGCEALLAWVASVGGGPMSMGVPALGAGLGGLSWEDVEIVMASHLYGGPPDVKITIYPPHV